MKTFLFWVGGLAFSLGLILSGYGAVIGTTVAKLNGQTNLMMGGAIVLGIGALVDTIEKANKPGNPSD